VHTISIGLRTSIQDGTICHVSHDSEYAPGGFALHIGDEVTVGHRVILHGCHIEDRCLIGMGSTLLDGAIIETEVIIGANTLVPQNKTLKSGYLYLGNPCRQIRRLRQGEKDFLTYSAKHYVKLKDRHLK